MPPAALVTAIDSAGDIDADGYDDVFFATKDGDGELWLAYGGAGGFDSFEIVVAGSAGNSLGVSVAGGVDLTGDGVPDAVVGGESKGVGAVHVVDMATRAIWHTQVGPSDTGMFGFSVDTTDAGGVPRIAVGAPHYAWASGGFGYGDAFVYTAGVTVWDAHVPGAVAHKVWDYIDFHIGVEVGFAQLDADADVELAVLDGCDGFD